MESDVATTPVHRGARTELSDDLLCPSCVRKLVISHLLKCLGGRAKGRIVNNTASSEQPSTEYDLLWQSNSLDMILFYWTWAVYLTKLHCRDIIGRRGMAKGHWEPFLEGQN
eukprot:scaffold4247_cov66-Cylindrotheca_fusiformis.AAC.19